MKNEKKCTITIGNDEYDVDEIIDSRGVKREICRIRKKKEDEKDA